MRWSPLGDVLAILFVPALVAGLACGVAWRLVPPGRLRTRLQIVAALLFFVPQVPVMFLLYRSIALLIYGEAVLASWMIAIAGLAAWRIRQDSSGAETPRRTERRSNPLVFAIIATMMGGFGTYLGWQCVADVFLPRAIVEGAVGVITPRYGTRSARLFDIVIGGQKLHVTHDVAAALRPGDVVRAEVGAGSHALLAVQKLSR